MMNWDYRVFFEDGGYTIRTVYYDDTGAIAACSEKETAPYGESLAELQAELNQLLAALKKPVISADDVPAPSDRPKAKRGKSLQAVRQQLGLQSEITKEILLSSKD
ncbi:MAG: hypothetical protein JGK24_02725 [Microcoleus sp. PH2017_29_MFU_D_A]|uniref:hypothetical protein n=1 Tax=unclassified Microcoleus TaxID=2642155 RepID=UPI001DE0DC13|nr:MULTISPECIES: hypothetical protein [unclassified Microcoleus]MCC3417673.1 hypothetical protein [Microcoleus sp. PH2017_07_MST_O_A]MCC3442672.1 hypothetical protein [Microcoleus sp. PH2017_03_ELD_O_A]MCC3501771.1 hypothetical protein [Microcoleus sp. PH2017_19_SFW_U_A]MCC3512565.1 hypothetical protein [Microcoleus sp. PH2017_17_BER_D_A]TAE11114.1 MAG: hypothetical protein EAZ94_16695 [Oscillatoriales cyanobacterium]